MRTLDSTLLAAFGNAVQRPAWLVQIGWSTVARLSSYDTVTFDSKTWTQADIDVSSIRVSDIKVSGSLVLGNADDLFAYFALSEGVADKAIRIYGYDASVSADYAVLLVDCVGGKATVDPSKVTITLRESSAFAYSPRAYVNAAHGFRHLLPAGAKVTINWQTYEIKR